MPYPGQQRKLRRVPNAAVVLGIACIAIALLAYVRTQARNQARSDRERRQAERRQEAFDRVKQGNSSVFVTDSKLLTMLANDEECRQIVTRLDFQSTDIDPTDATSVSQLKNVSSMTFYCTTGTRGMLLAAQTLPITELHFEMPDLSSDAYLMLKDLSQLKKVRFEHVMDDHWIERLNSEMPSVVIEAPYRRSMGPVTAQ